MSCKLGILLSFLIAHICVGNAGNRNQVPPKENLARKPALTSSRLFTGVIRDDALPGDEVILNRALLLDEDDDTLQGDEICGYTLYKSNSEIPFKVILTDHVTGAGKIILGQTLPHHGLTSSKSGIYRFQVAAHGCHSSQHAPRMDVEVHVRRSKDKFKVKSLPKVAPAPHMDHNNIVEVVEGRVFTSIIKLDADCAYQLVTEGVPFVLSKDGVLSNTEPLSFATRHNYLLQAEAHGCSKKGEKITISVKVRKMCRPRWNGFNEKMDFIPGFKSKAQLATNPSLETCDPTCNVRNVTVKVTLETDHIGKGCDRDTYSVENQRKLCGASKTSVDLLPVGEAFTKDLPRDDGKESDQIFSFDGRKNAVKIPKSRVNPHLGSKFTFSTWMKHGHTSGSTTRKGRKEHLLCNSDGEGMNRHHYAFFIHHCKLIFLLRQEPENGVDMNVFKPSEWRWKLGEVCDNQWHHYAVSVDYPKVTLYLDGKQFFANKDNPEILDDWPLHSTKKVHFSQLSVGACWMGGEKKMNHFFEGYLAGMSLLRDVTESDDVIRCLNECLERLDFHAMRDLNTGMSLTMDTDMSEVIIRGHNIPELTRLLTQIGYINRRNQPTPGHRAVRVRTQITCADRRKLDMADQHLQVHVQQAEPVILTVSGSPEVAAEEHALKRGAHVFRDVEVVSATRQERKELQREDLAKASSGRRLDRCVIRGASGNDVDLTQERLLYPEHQVEQLGLEATFNEKGLVISGAELASQYEAILRNVRYVYRTPEDINERSLEVVCSDMSHRFVSNAFVIQVEVTHVVHKEAVPKMHQQQSSNMVERPQHSAHVQSSLLGSASGSVASSTSSVSMTIIVVVSVGFLALLIILGVMRIRSAHQRSQVVTVDEKQEMEWDNSALTITVNPMERGEQEFAEEGELQVLRDEDESSDDDDASMTQDDLDSSEDEQETKVKDREFEWDDSALTFENDQWARVHKPHDF